jgi:hypothetical protein
MVDYGVGQHAVVQEADARAMASEAARFVDRIAEILAKDPS